MASVRMIARSPGQLSFGLRKVVGSGEVKQDQRDRSMVQKLGYCPSGETDGWARKDLAVLWVRVYSGIQGTCEAASGAKRKGNM